MRKTKPTPSNPLQVGGHGGKLSLLFEGDRVLKPATARRECRWYEELSSGKLPPVLAESGLVPRFHGFEERLLDGGETRERYLVLENVTHGFVGPSILDVKIGTRTWDSECDERKKRTHVEIDAASTTSSLGFRFGGVTVFDPDTGGRRSLGKLHGIDATPETICDRLVEFITPSRRDLAESFARKLGPAREFFRLATHRIFASSLLFLYDVPGGHEPDVRLIDFAHVWNAEEYPDDSGALIGVENLIRCWKSVASR